VNRRVVALLHLGYWLVYLLLLVVLLGALRLQFRPGPSLLGLLLTSPIGLLSILPNVAAFYFSYAFVSPRLLERRRVAASVAAGLAGSFAAALGGLLLVFAWLGPAQPVFQSGTEFAGMVISLGLVATLHSVIALIMRGFIAWYGDQHLKQELAAKTHEMELALVRSKFDPHFLFNTLNNIDVLISKDPVAASAYLHKLSDILRFVLYEATAPLIPLSEEIAYILKYIELERIRSGNPAFVECEVSGSAEGCRVAPMLFIPFIENAFKHTADRRAAAAVRIGLSISGAMVTFECRNESRAGASCPPATSGLGNELIRRRLALLYPNRHELRIKDENGAYHVQLTVTLS